MRYIFVICIIVAFILGRLSSNHLVSSEKSFKSDYKQLSTSTIHSIADTKKDSTTVKLTTKKEIYYSPKGKISKVVITDENYSNKDNSINLSDITKNTFATSDTRVDSKEIKSFLPNYSFTIMSPISLSTPYLSPDITLQLGYRLFNTTYIDISTNQHLSTSVGFTMLL